MIWQKLTNSSVPCLVQPYSFLEWEASGKGLSTKMVTSLLGGVPPRGGTAVVINAKGGREVSAISKAGLKVLAAYSEAKEAFPGVLEDSKTGKKLGGTDQSDAGEQVEKGPTEKTPTVAAGAGQSKGKAKAAEYEESAPEAEKGREEPAEGEGKEGENEEGDDEEGEEESEEEAREGDDEGGGAEAAKGEGEKAEETVEEKVEEGAGGKDGEKAAKTGQQEREAAGGSGEAGESIAGSSDPYTEELKRVEQGE